MNWPSCRKHFECHRGDITNLKQPRDKQQNLQEERQQQPKEPFLEEKRSRTYTFYNLNTQNDISNLVIDALCHKINLEASEIIHKIFRDSRFRSRYML